MKKLIFQMESMLICLINQKSFMICHYWHFLDNSFSYGPYLYDGCYNMMQICNKFKNIAIVHIKESVYRICLLYVSKREAKKLMTNLIDKKGD